MEYNLKDIGFALPLLQIMSLVEKLGNSLSLEVSLSMCRALGNMGYCYLRL